MLLASDAGRRVLDSWPQYQRSVVLDSLGRPHVHLDVFRRAACCRLVDSWQWLRSLRTDDEQPLLGGFGMHATNLATAAANADKLQHHGQLDGQCRHELLLQA